MNHSSVIAVLNKLEGIEYLRRYLEPPHSKPSDRIKWTEEKVQKLIQGQFATLRSKSTFDPEEKPSYRFTIMHVVYDDPQHGDWFLATRGENREHLEVVWEKTIQDLKKSVMKMAKSSVKKASQKDRKAYEKEVDLLNEFFIKYGV